MVTVVDPSGSPTIVYNRDGVTISSLTGGVSGSSSDAVAIVRYSQSTVVLVQTPNSNASPALSLPSDAEVGDVVEVYGLYNAATTGRVTPNVYPNSGETVNFKFTSTDGIAYTFARFRKVAATEWVVINSSSPS